MSYGFQDMIQNSSDLELLNLDARVQFVVHFTSTECTDTILHISVLFITQPLFFITQPLFIFGFMVIGQKNKLVENGILYLLIDFCED